MTEVWAVRGLLVNNPVEPTAEHISYVTGISRPRILRLLHGLTEAGLIVSRLDDRYASRPALRYSMTALGRDALLLSDDEVAAIVDREVPDPKAQEARKA